MSLATCRFNKNHKVKRSRLEIHEQSCPDRYYVNPEDMIHKDKYLTSTEVKYDKEIIADIRKYIFRYGDIIKENDENSLTFVGSNYRLYSTKDKEDYELLEDKPWSFSDDELIYVFEA